MSAANAVTSLYGGSVARKRSAADALCGNVGGQAREQETWTPAWIIEVAREALGGKIHLDPCAASVPAAWFAERNMTLPDAALQLESALRMETDKTERRRLKRVLKSEYHLKCGGLVGDWDAESAYVNQPFEYLAPWLQKCVDQAKRGVKIVQLGPVRPHRSWWRPRVTTGQIVYLRYDVKFQGHRSAFPAPLALVSWNCVIPWLGERETGRE